MVKTLRVGLDMHTASTGTGFVYQQDIGHLWMRSLGSRGRTCPGLRMLAVFNIESWLQ